MSKIYIVVEITPEGETGCQRICAVSFSFSGGYWGVKGSFEEVSTAPLKNAFLNSGLTHRFSEWAKNQGRSIIWVCPNSKSDFYSVLLVLYKISSMFNVEATRPLFLTHVGIASMPYKDLGQYTEIQTLHPQFKLNASPIERVTQFGQIHLRIQNKKVHP